MWPSAPAPRSPRLSLSKSVAEPGLSPGSAGSHPLLGDWRLDPHRAVWPGGGYSWEHALPVCPRCGSPEPPECPQDTSARGAVCRGRQALRGLVP